MWVPNQSIALTRVEPLDAIAADDRPAAPGGVALGAADTPATPSADVERAVNASTAAEDRPW
jgi:hypothetical protein